MLVELEQVQGRYNSLFERALEKEKKVKSGSYLFPGLGTSTSSTPASSYKPNVAPIQRKSTDSVRNRDVLNTMEEF
jgi:hypothetical protein